MPGHLWNPPRGRGPGLLLVQEIFGVSGYIRRRGAALAEAGYRVLAPELYWRLDPQTRPVDEAAPDAVETAASRAMSLDWQTTVADAVAALTHLRHLDDVGAVGAIGFCFGGGVAFNVAAVTEVECLVSYYGSALPGLLDLAPRVTAPSLHHFGLSDDYIDPGAVRRIRAAVTAANDQVEFETYPGANHAFDNDDLFLFHPEASELAWQRTLHFLAERLPVPG